MLIFRLLCLLILSSLSISFVAAIQPAPQGSPIIQKWQPHTVHPPKERDDLPVLLIGTIVYLAGSITLIILKATSVLTWSWLAILAPLWVIGAVTLLLLLGSFLFVSKYTRVKKDAT